MKATTFGVRLAALAALLATTACSQAGAIGDILGGVLAPQGQGQGQGTSQATGEILGVDPNQQIIQIRTQQGQTGNVYFDQNTRVVYQQREYPVTALERGDVVTLQIQQDQRGAAYTNYVLVQQSVQDRGGTSSGGTYNGGASAVQRFAGTVSSLDLQRGTFVLRTQQGNAQVVLPYNLSSSDRQRFQSLRNGQSVTLDGRMVAQGRIDLERFAY